MDLVNDIDDSNAWAVGRFDALMSQAKLPEGVASQIPAVKLFSASGHINGGLSGSSAPRRATTRPRRTCATSSRASSRSPSCSPTPSRRFRRS